MLKLHRVKLVDRAGDKALLELRVERLEVLVVVVRSVLPEVEGLPHLGFMSLEVRNWRWVYC